MPTKRRMTSDSEDGDFKISRNESSESEDSEMEGEEPGVLISTVQTTPEYSKDEDEDIMMEAETSQTRLNRIELNKRRDIFLQFHANTYNNLLPQNNYINNLVRKSQHKVTSSVYQYKLLPQPKLVKNGTMKQYQLETLAFLVYMYENGMSAILASEMGLGKSMNVSSLSLSSQNSVANHFLSLQTLSLFAYLSETHGITTHLIICPLSVLSAWMTELKRWTPNYKALRFHG